MEIGVASYCTGIELVNGARKIWRRYKAGEAVPWISRELGQRCGNIYRVRRRPKPCALEETTVAADRCG